MSIPYIPIQVVLQTGNGNNLLTWPLVAGATSYAIQRSTDGITYSSLATATSNSYLDSAVTIGTNYYYQVAATNTSGTSPFATSYPLSITPCLPGQISLGYLRYLTQLRADKLNSEYLTTDEWNSNINQSIYSLYDILVTKFGDDYFFAPPLIIPLTGIQYYPLPDGSNYPVNGVNSPAMYKLNGIDANVNGTFTGPNAGWVPIARMNWSDRDKYTTWPAQAGALNNVYQMGYRQMGTNLFIFPNNTNMVIRVWYVPVMTQLLQDTDMLSFSISGWSEYVINDAAMKAMVKEESLEKWQALSAANQAMMERIETTAANRDVGQSNSVSNIRGTMADPGFSGWGNGFGGGGIRWSWLLMSVPLSSKLPWETANPIWASQLNPIISSPLSSVIILETIALINGVNVINHKLGRMQKGWFITDINAAAMIYRSASFNTTTLTLTSNAGAIVNIGVF